VFTCYREPLLVRNSRGAFTLRAHTYHGEQDGNPSSDIEDGDAEEDDETECSHKEGKEDRAAVFATWLIGTFGRTLLCSGRGVVDVAAGRGQLSAELCHQLAPQRSALLLDGGGGADVGAGKKAVATDVAVECEGTAVGEDSASSSCGSMGLAGPNSTTTPANPTNTSGTTLASTSTNTNTNISPPGTTTADTTTTKTSTSTHPATIHLRCNLVEPKPREGAMDQLDPMGALPADSLIMLAECFDSTTFPTKHATLLSLCSMLVGLHPDQPTEAIIDVALALNKPFAVVPCCVFPSLFKDRRNAAGRHVVGYVGLVRYLKAKDPRIESVRLGFQGRDRVLFFRP
jgi:hypothetical protein